jgi:peptide/nickel transport system ATP-binding protein
VLHLFQELNRQEGVSIILITHDLGVVSQICHRTLVMYAGEIVESGQTKDLLKHPRHPYTQALINALPDQKDPSEPLQAISGEVIDLRNRPAGCAFAPRCPYKMPVCEIRPPRLERTDGEHSAACWLGRES